MRVLFLLSFFILAIASSLAQESLPAVKIKDLNGNMIDASTLTNDGHPMILSFWATWCKPCIRELSAISDMYIDWQDETGVKLIAVSIDDTRLSSKVKPFVNSQGWEYDVYLDENSELRRYLNVNNIPHTFLLDGDGKVVWQHNGYFPGDEDHLYELVQKLARGEKINE
jgi:cytochrome c biogenesis protein CcmG/thiol:disulfide interchange protein DsbE